MTPAHARRPHAAFEELDVIRTRATLSVEGGIVPSGSLGAVVLVHRDGKAFEVEFTDPICAVITLEASDIEPA